MTTDQPGAGAVVDGAATATGAAEPWAHLRDLVEPQLREVARRDGDASRALNRLAEAIEYSLLAPGKRVRPVLALAAVEACGGDVARAVPAACAFELVHAYSLVHDDLPCMDDDELRRGMPTSHKVFGEGVAVLVGDALQAAAFEQVAGATGLEDAVRVQVTLLLARAIGWHGMVGGQYLDIEHGARDEQGLRELHARKTGALLQACVEAGAVLGGAGQDDRERFRRFGAGIGWLFQLVDDLLDEVGEQEATGKQTGRDRRHGKVTAVDLFGVDGVRAAADEQLEECLAVARGLPAGGGLLPDIARYVRDRDR